MRKGLGEREMESTAERERERERETDRQRERERERETKHLLEPCDRDHLCVAVPLIIGSADHTTMCLNADARTGSGVSGVEKHRIKREREIYRKREGSRGIYREKEGGRGERERRKEMMRKIHRGIDRDEEREDGEK